MTSPITIPVGAHTFAGVRGAIAALALEQFVAGDLPHVCIRPLARIDTVVDVMPLESTILRSLADVDHRSWIVAGDGWRARVERYSQHGNGDVQVYARTAELAEAVADDIASRCPDPRAADSVSVTMWHKSESAPSSRTRPVHTSPWSSTARNYPRAVREALDQLVDLTPDEQGGRVVLLHGEPGTGKTSAIRTLLWEWRAWSSAHLVLDGDTFVHDAGYLAHVTTQAATDDRWVVVVLEDAGDLVDDENPFGGDLSRLLNISDGIVGMGTHALFVLTTNEPVRALHPALTRPGRCLANIEFETFTRREAIEWLGTERGVSASDLTLAELYALAGATTQITSLAETERHGVYL